MAFDFKSKWNFNVPDRLVTKDDLDNLPPGGVDATGVLAGFAPVADGNGGWEWQEVSGTAGLDDPVAALVANPASDTGVALSATIATALDGFEGGGSSLIVVNGGTVDLPNAEADAALAGGRIFLIGYKVTATATIAGVSFSPGSYIFERDSSVGTGWTYRTIAAATEVGATPSATYADEVAADNPTTFLRFENNTTNEGSVSEVYTPTSITYGAALGDGSNAAVFNGSSSMLAAPQGAGTGLGGCTAFTVEAIVKSNSFATSQVIGLQNNIWEFQINTVGRISVNINGGAGAAQTSGGLTVGVPAHVAATYDGTSAKLYINGTEVASAAKTGALNNYGTAPPRIGSNGTAVFFNGSIDGYALYRNSALSAARILAHATAALG